MKPTPKELAQWMKKHGKTQEYVCLKTHVSVRTIQRFLAEETEHPHLLVLDAFQAMMNESEKEEAL